MTVSNTHVVTCERTYLFQYKFTIPHLMDVITVSAFYLIKMNYKDLLIYKLYFFLI